MSPSTKGTVKQVRYEKRLNSAFLSGIRHTCLIFNISKLQTGYDAAKLKLDFWSYFIFTIVCKIRGWLERWDINGDAYKYEIPTHERF